MKRTNLLCIGLCLCITLSVYADTFGTGDNQFEIDFVTISGDTNPTSGYGIVNNDYRMGIYEITNSQWISFVNSTARTVTGSPSYAYRYDSHWTGTNLPTSNVSWLEAAQFVNWLNTSTGHQAAYNFTGTQGTEDYTFSVWDVTEAWDGTNLYRHKDAYYFLPTEDEWAKAAYWNGTTFQTYATTGDNVPVAGIDSNFESVIGQPWDVGSGSEELNGTYDMMGNLLEWMENPRVSGDYLPNSYRSDRGGYYDHLAPGISSSFRRYAYPDLENYGISFRVASVPEPATLVLLGLGGLTLRRRKKA